MDKQKTSDALTRYHAKKSSSFRYESNLPPKYFEAIGRIAVNFAALEHALLLSISWLSKEKRFKRTLCLVGGESFDVLLAKCRKLFRTVIADESLQREFLDLAGTLEQINVDRNTFLHSTWYTDPEDIIVLTNPIPSRLKFKKHMNKDGKLSEYGMVELPVLEELGERISIAIGSLHTFMFEIADLAKLSHPLRTKTIPPRKRKESMDKIRAWLERTHLKGDFST